MSIALVPFMSWWDSDSEKGAMCRCGHRRKWHSPAKSWRHASDDNRLICFAYVTNSNSINICGCNNFQP